MGFTRMQATIPISVSDRLESWRSPLARQLTALNNLEFPVQLGGAAGSLDKLGSHGTAVRAALAEELGLADTRQWQSQRDGIADIGHHLSLVTGALGKIGQDLALMAQSGREISMSGGGKSSAMAHKQNPVRAETWLRLLASPPYSFQSCIRRWCMSRSGLATRMADPAADGHGDRRFAAFGWRDARTTRTNGNGGPRLIQLIQSPDLTASAAQRTS